MALFGRKKTTVGLDIGSGLIKVAVMDHSQPVPELVKVAITPLLADAIVEGEIMDPGIVSDAILACLAAAGVTTKEVVTAHAAPLPNASTRAPAALSHAQSEFS